MGTLGNMQDGKSDGAMWGMSLVLYKWSCLRPLLQLASCSQSRQRAGQVSNLM